MARHACQRRKSKSQGEEETRRQSKPQILGSLSPRLPVNPLDLRESLLNTLLPWQGAKHAL